MIELRWVIVGKNRQLQYRYRLLDKRLFPLGEDKGVWTDWADVPEIDCNEAAWEDVRKIDGRDEDPVFLNHLGIPSMDFTFDGPYGVYHSAYDSHAWMARIGDSGFAYHAAMVRLWGVMALRLANAEVLPFDYAAYGRDLVVYLDEVSTRALARQIPLDLTAARAAAEQMAALPPPAAATRQDLPAVNRALLRAERDLTSPEGIPDRPWFRHLVYAPLPSYEAETLPGVREAVEAGDPARAQQQADLLARAIARAAATLAATVPAPEPPGAGRPRD